MGEEGQGPRCKRSRRGQNNPSRMSNSGGTPLLHCKGVYATPGVALGLLTSAADARFGQREGGCTTRGEEIMARRLDVS